jgi:hypothetical protein
MAVVFLVAVVLVAAAMAAIADYAVRMNFKHAFKASLSRRANLTMLQ